MFQDTDKRVIQLAHEVEELRLRFEHAQLQLEEKLTILDQLIERQRTNLQAFERRLKQSYR